MSRAEALCKLLALGPLPRREIDRIAGGDRLETEAAMGQLLRAGAVTWRHDGSGQRLYALRPA